MQNHNFTIFLDKLIVQKLFNCKVTYSTVFFDTDSESEVRFLWSPLVFEL